METIQRLADKRDLEKVDKMIVENIIQILTLRCQEEAQGVNTDGLMVSLEGNIWAALSRMKYKFEKMHNIDTPSPPKFKRDPHYKMLGNGVPHQP